jgi:hypothetical protein
MLYNLNIDSIAEQPTTKHTWLSLDDIGYCNAAVVLIY